MRLKAKPSIVIVGSINVDMFFKTDDLPSPGESVFASTFNRSFGGKGANQAVAVAKLGGKAIMVGRIGQDESSNELLDNFIKAGVDTKYVIRDPESSSGMAFITVDNKGENTIVIYSGANMKLSTSDVDRVIDDVRVSDLVVAQLEIPISTVERIGEISNEYNVPFILNPAPAPSRDISGILNKVDILCPNKSEAEALTGEKILNIDDAKKVGYKLRDAGVKSVVLTLGASGAILVTENIEQHLPSPSVNVCDTTGAGDAFVGSFAYSLAYGNTISDAVKFANVTAAISVTKDGTQSGLPTLEEIKELKQKIYGSE